MSVLTLTSKNFEEEVKKSNKIVLIDFWAQWCGPCKMQSPIVDKIEEEFQGKAIIGKVNVDDEPELASQFGIMSIPTLIFFKDGNVVDTQIGLTSKNEIEDILKKYL